MPQLLIMKKEQRHASKISVSVAGHPNYGYVLVYRGDCGDALEALEAAVMGLRNQASEPDLSPEAVSK